MSLDIKKFLSEGEKVEYQGQEIQVIPLSIGEQAKFAQLQKEEKLAEASEFLFIQTLKKVDPTLTDEEILKINDREFIGLITQKILKVNGLEVPKNFQEPQQQPQTQ